MEEVIEEYRSKRPQRIKKERITFHLQSTRRTDACLHCLSPDQSYKKLSYGKARIRDLKKVYWKSQSQKKVNLKSQKTRQKKSTIDHSSKKKKKSQKKRQKQVEKKSKKIKTVAPRLGGLLESRKVKKQCKKHVKKSQNKVNRRPQLEKVKKN